MRGASRQRGVVKIDTLEFEGMKYPIKLHKDKGEFEVWVGDERVKDRSLDELKRRAREKLQETSQERDWEAVINVELEEKRYGSLGYYLDFKRYFRFQKDNGEWLFRHFKGEDENAQAELGEPLTKHHYRPEKRVIIPYTPEAWKGCQRVEHLEEELKKQVFETVSKAVKASKKKAQGELAQLSQAEVQIVYPIPKPRKRKKK